MLFCWLLCNKWILLHLTSDFLCIKANYDKLFIQHWHRQKNKKRFLGNDHNRNHAKQLKTKDIRKINTKDIDTIRKLKLCFVQFISNEIILATGGAKFHTWVSPVTLTLVTFLLHCFDDWYWLHRLPIFNFVQEFIERESSAFKCTISQPHSLYEQNSITMKTCISLLLYICLQL